MLGDIPPHLPLLPQVTLVPYHHHIHLLPLDLLGILQPRLHILEGSLRREVIND